MPLQSTAAVVRPFDVPQIWWEWFCSLYDPDLYMLDPQSYGCTVTALLQAGNFNFIEIPELFFCFGIETRGFVTATGALWTVPYRVGYKIANGNDWFNGQWLCGMVSGDGGSVFQKPKRFEWPKLLDRNQRVTVTVDNNITGGAALSVDALVHGYRVVKLNEPIQRRAA